MKIRFPWTKKEEKEAIIVPTMRRDRTLLAKFREERYKTVVEELRKAQIGEDAPEIDPSMLKQYEEVTPDSIRVQLGMPPTKIYIELDENTVKIRPLFTPDDLPIDARQERKMLTEGVEEARQIMNEFYEDK